MNGSAGPLRFFWVPLFAALAAAPPAIAQEVGWIGAQGSPVTDAAFSADGSLVITGREDGTAQLWDAQTAEPLAELHGHSRRISKVDFSPDGKFVLTAAADGIAKLWDTRTADAIHVLGGHSQGITDAAFSPDGSKVVTASADQTARVWETSSGEMLSILRGHEYWLSSASFSPDGSLILTSGWDGAAIVWDAATFERLQVVRCSGPLSSACFHLDGRTFAAAVWGGGATIGNAMTGDALASLGKGTTAVSFSPDSRVLLTGHTDGTLRLWDVPTGSLLQTLDGRGGAVASAQFDCHAERVLAVYSESASFKMASGGGVSTYGGHERFQHVTAPCVLDLASRGAAFTLGNEDSPITLAVYDPACEQILSAAQNGLVLLSNAESGRPVRILGRGVLDRVDSVAFHPDGTRFVALGERDLHFSSETGASLSPLGERPAIRFDEPKGEAQTRRFLSDQPESYRWAEGHGVLTLTGAERLTSLVFMSPDGTRAVTVPRKVSFLERTSHLVDAVRIWDTDSGFERYTLDLSLLTEIPESNSVEISHVAFSPDSSRMICTGMIWKFEEHGTRTFGWPSPSWIFDLPSGVLMTTLDVGQGSTNHASFSPDGLQVATARADGRIRIWSASTGDSLLEIEGHEGGVSTVRYRPDGQQLVSAGRDGTARVWDAETGALLSVLSGHDGPLNSACFSPDGTRIATTSEDRTARLWESSQGQLLATFAWSGDGTDWICFTPSLHFIGTEGAACRMQVFLGGLCYPLASYTSTLRSPEKVKAALAGERVGKPTLFPPPTLLVSSLAQHSSIANDRNFVLRAMASAPRVGMKRLHVFQDGEPIPREEIDGSSAPGPDRDSLQLALPIAIPSERGETSFSLYAEDQRGTLSREQTFMIRYEPPSRDLYLLALGVADYDEDKLDLAFPVRDAEAITAALKSQEGGLYRAVHVEQRTDGDVDMAEVLRLRDQFLLRAGEDDTIVVFVAGHGMRTATNSYWFLTSPCTGSDPYAGIPRDALESLVSWEKLRARRRVLVLDTCHSGADLAGRSGRGVTVYQQDEVDHALQDGGGLYILAASSDDELAAESEGNGLFTGELLRGLAGEADRAPLGNGDGYVQIEELKHFAEVRVLERSRGKQRPTFPQVRAGENFPLARVPQATQNAATEAKR